MAAGTADADDDARLVARANWKTVVAIFCGIPKVKKRDTANAWSTQADDDTYGDFGQFRALGDPYSRLYNPTPVPDLNDGGQDWWILKFGSNKAVPIEQLVEAVCTLPLDAVATVPEKLVDTLARAFAPEQLINKSQVSVVLGLIDPATSVDIDVGFTGTQLLQYLLDRTLLQVRARSGRTRVQPGNPATRPYS